MLMVMMMIIFQSLFFRFSGNTCRVFLCHYRTLLSLLLLTYLLTPTNARSVCWLEREAGHVMDIVGMKKIHLLMWEHAAKCTEVCA